MTLLLGVAWFQALLKGIGTVLAYIYKLVPNYGVAIILLTVAIRVILLPLGVKQIRSMQGMQAIQPKIKALQQKYKGGDRQKLNEEMMALYKTHGVNPLSGCLPLLAQFPVLIALFAVLRVPGGIVHIPETSRLHTAIIQQDTHFLGANLLCNALQAGHDVNIVVKKGDPPPQIKTLSCGKGIPVRIPFYALAALMIGTTFYQQRQMQRVTPAGANPQQQMMTRIMPILFGVWGFVFPAGLVVYWITTNLMMIAQQQFLISRGHLGNVAADSSNGGRKPGNAAKRLAAGKSGSQRPTSGSNKTGGRPGSSNGNKSGSGKPKSGAGGGQKRTAAQRGAPPKSRGAGASTPEASGGRDAGDRKKRRKR
jgi:YidC/Oxa1 family membrane protein insertase